MGAKIAWHFIENEEKLIFITSFTKNLNIDILHSWQK